MTAPFKVERMNEEAKKASSNQKLDFSEYMWMADLESFDREVRSKIEEEDYIRSSIELLLDEEERETVYFDTTGPRYRQQNNGVYSNDPHGQYNQVEYVYGADNIGYAMGNLQLDDFTHQYYDHQAQPVVNQQGSWVFLPSNEVLPHQPFPNSHSNSYGQVNGTQNGNFQSQFQTHGETQNNSGPEVQKATAFGAKQLNPYAVEFIPRGSNQ